MAKRDLQVRHSAYGTKEWPTEANVDLGLAEGDGVKLAGTGTNFATIVLTGDPEQGTDMFMGVTKSAGSQTAAANGVVNVEIVGPGSIISGKATTPANMNTAAELLGLMGDFVAFDRSAATAAGILTIDEDEGTDPDVHGLMIIDGDIVKGILEVFTANATIWRGLV